MIYFDSGATTFEKPHEVAVAMRRALAGCASPGRGGYRQAMLAAETVFNCRQTAADLFDAQPEQVVFTLNATHGLNIAIRSLVQPGQRVVISGFEHNAVTRPLALLDAQVAVAGHQLFDSQLLLEEFDRALQTPAAAVICTHVSNVFGYRLPVQEIGDLCRQRGVPFVLDASQSAGCLPVRLQQLGADFIAFPGHKSLYGPQGTGVLLCGQPGQPLLAGGTGSQSVLQQMPDQTPDRHEAGTMNVTGIAGLQAGLDFVRHRGAAEILRGEVHLKNQLARALQQLSGVRVYADFTGHQTGVLSFSTPMDCEELAQELARHSIAVRAGLHCAPLAHRSAGTLDSGTVRVSFSAFNTPGQVRRFVTVLTRILSKRPGGNL